MSIAIKTFVFLDLETTGLPEDCPKITELCLVAVHRTSLENPLRHTARVPPQLPRILDKLCLFLDPGKPVTPKAVEITGLNNGSLVKSEKPHFDDRTVTLILDFLRRQAQPVCLVAHNGNGYDFPLLKAELQMLGEDLRGSIYCLDTQQALKELDQNSGSDRDTIPSSYSLSLLYKHYFQEDPNDAHYAEGDVLAMLQVFLRRATELLKYAATRAKTWTEVQPMYTSRLQQMGNV